MCSLFVDYPYCESFLSVSADTLIRFVVEYLAGSQAFVQPPNSMLYLLKAGIGLDGRNDINFMDITDPGISNLSPVRAYGDVFPIC